MRQPLRCVDGRLKYQVWKVRVGLRYDGEDDRDSKCEKDVLQSSVGMIGRNGALALSHVWYPGNVHAANPKTK